VTADIKLPPYCSGFEIGIEQLMETVPQHAPYQPLNRFPELEQDFCLRASVRYSYQELADFMNKYIRALSKPEGYNYKIEPLDIFQKEGDSGHKQTTWRIILWHQERTLTTAETNRLLDELAQQAKKELKAERI
jgi:phenylalanyl-tRNA synthetase beta subunit